MIDVKPEHDTHTNNRWSTYITATRRLIERDGLLSYVRRIKRGIIISQPSGTRYILFMFTVMSFQTKK